MAFETLTTAELESMTIPMPTTIDMVTAEEVQRSYNAAMDSVNLLNAGKPVEMTDEAWVDTVKRNKEHLSIQLAKPEFYAGFDLTPFEQAVASVI